MDKFVKMCLGDVRDWYYEVEKSLKKKDAEVRRKRSGVYMYADLRGRSPNDRLEFFSVPVNKENRSALKRGMFEKLKTLSERMGVPVVFFNIFHNNVVYFLVHEGKAFKIKAVSPVLFFRSLMKRSSLLQVYEEKARVWRGKKMPYETQDSAVAFSYFHNFLPENCWCVDVDCFDGFVFYEVKRRGEPLTYNQRVLKGIVERSGYKFRILEV